MTPLAKTRLVQVAPVALRPEWLKGHASQREANQLGQPRSNGPDGGLALGDAALQFGDLSRSR